nr:1,4-alpha-glucan branching protein GlgB [Aestuariicella hydrocarbonica]
MVAGHYDDVFGVLGMHDHPDGGLVVRCLLPWAESVELLDGKSGRKLGDLQKVHKSGLYELSFKRRRNRFAYRFRATGWQASVELEDPYRFSSCLAESDLYLFNEGTQEKTYRWMGSHAKCLDGVDGVHFVVWAPAARRVSVVGDFNGWDGRQHMMRKHPAAGVWDIFIPGVQDFALYKYEILDGDGHLLPLKADPYARSMQHPPETASRVLKSESFPWCDSEWLACRERGGQLQQPVSIYEVNLASWRRVPEEGNRYLSYAELADQLIPYVLDMDFTHIQLMPVSEFPFDGSWGYQPIGLYAPSIRFGTPDEFKGFINQCHKRGLGVLLDWVPGHFPTDIHGLGRFDGTCLYEHMDKRKGFHPDWNTLIYNYGRREVISYLLSNANFWIEEYHIDGLRVDAVASMLYLDYSREHGEWEPNEQGGRENLEAIEFLRTVNTRLYQSHPGILMIAEESTAWPGVSKPVDQGGLGFGLKWNMGWMNDTLRYMERDPIYRQHHQNEMTFGIMYAWSEHFILPLSHDEVVHGKHSLIDKMPGDDWQKFANLRAYLGFMWAHPGKKLLFMGGEFGQYHEWNHDKSLDWHLLREQKHRGVQSLVRDLNRTYRSLSALYRLDSDPAGFQWLQLNNHQLSILAWIRWGGESTPPVVIISNFTPETYRDYRAGVPWPGRYIERLNTDGCEYGGSGQGNGGAVVTRDTPWDDQPQSLQLTLPPLATLVLEWQSPDTGSIS